MKPEEDIEKKLYIPPDFYVLDFEETKSGMAYDPEEDDYNEPPVGPS